MGLAGKLPRRTNFIMFHVDPSNSTRSVRLGTKRESRSRGNKLLLNLYGQAEAHR